MSHLPIESRLVDAHIPGDRLAALVDEPPTAAERAHLGLCATCAAGLDAQRALLAMAEAERGTMGMPLTRWDSLATQLRSEGLIAGAQRRRFTRVALPSSRSLLQVAAALILVASGVVMGRASAGVPFLPGITGDEQGQVAKVRPFSEKMTPVTFASVEEAEQWRNTYAAGLQSAVSYLAEHDSSTLSPETPAVMRARLSALDQVSRTMRQALNDAPNDPVINDFYIHSFGQREATLRQLNAVLPQGVRMNGF